MSNQNIKLSKNEAIVLFEYLSRSIDAKNFQINHQSELAVLEKILCYLEEDLTEPFDDDYQEKLKSAQASLIK